jgi:hypothetical protein
MKKIRGKGRVLKVARHAEADGSPDKQLYNPLMINTGRTWSIVTAIPSPLTASDFPVGDRG